MSPSVREEKAEGGQGPGWVVQGKLLKHLLLISTNSVSSTRLLRLGILALSSTGTR